MTDRDTDRNPEMPGRRTVLRGAAVAGLGGTGAVAGRASAGSKPHTITVRAAETPFRYRIRVSGEIEKGEFAGATDEIEDGDVAVGFVEAGNTGELDSYSFSGKIVDFDVLEGSPEVIAVDGKAVDDPVGFPRSDLPNRITIEADGPDVEYEFQVSGRVEKGSRSGSGDRVLDSDAVRGAVGGDGVDDYRFSGAVAFAEPDGPLTTTLEFDAPGDH